MLSNRLKKRLMGMMLTVVLFASAFATTASPRSPSENRLAIDFQATDLQGNAFNGRSLQGKIVLIDFWATWCAPCVKAIPTLSRLNDDFRNRGFQVVGIATYSGTAEEVSEFLEEHQASYTMLMGDEDLAEKFQVIGYPTYVLIGPDGNLHKQYMGELDNLYEEVAGQIGKLRKR